MFLQPTAGEGSGASVHYKFNKYCARCKYYIVYALSRVSLFEQFLMHLISNKLYFFMNMILPSTIKNKMLVKLHIIL